MKEEMEKDRKSKRGIQNTQKTLKVEQDQKETTKSRIKGKNIKKTTPKKMDKIINKKSKKKMNNNLKQSQNWLANTSTEIKKHRKHRKKN